MAKALLLLAFFSSLNVISCDVFGTEGLFDPMEAEIEKGIRKEEANCKDFDLDSCAYFLKWKLCSVYRHSLRNRCRKSCNICASNGFGVLCCYLNVYQQGNEKCAYTYYGCCWDMLTPAKGPNGKGCPKNCHNRFGKHKCALLKLSGACEKNQELMYEMCRGVCFCDWNVKAEAPRCAESKFGCCWDGETLADERFEQCPVCRDYFPKRICNLFQPLCPLYGYLSGWQMRRACPNTCGICSYFNENILMKYNEDLEKQGLLMRK